MIGILALLLAFNAIQDEKTPVPSDEQQRNAQKIIREIFGEEYQERDPGKLGAFAKKLLRQALEARNDPAGRYVLLREAADIAAKAGDVETAFGAADKINDLYETGGGLQLKDDVLSTIRSRIRTTEERQRYADFSFRLACDALRANDFSLAKSSARQAESYARLARDQRLYELAKDLSKEIPVFEREHRAVEKALLTLSANPEDPDASKTYGTYLCFIKGDWKKGLGFLAASGDAKLEEIAKLEAAESSDPETRCNLAELYDRLAEENRSNPLKERNLLSRALSYYSAAAQGGLKGLAKIKAEKRIEEIRNQGAKAAPLAGSSTLTPNAQFILKQGDTLEVGKHSNGPKVERRSIRIEASLKDRAEGVILAQGGISYGYALYIKDSKLHYALRNNRNLRTVTAPQTLPNAACIVGVVMTKAGKVTLFVNGRAVADETLPGSLATTPGEPLVVGQDLKTPAGRYSTPFKYQGTILLVRLQIGDE